MCSRRWLSSDSTRGRTRPVSGCPALLRGAGVGYAGGFALDVTHYDSTENQIAFGAKLARALSAAHIPNRHFVINTAQNGRSFTTSSTTAPIMPTRQSAGAAPPGAA